MGKHATKRFDEPDETRSFDNGKLDVVHLSGSTAAQAIGPGDVYEILPGHDAWVAGNDRFSALEFQSKTAEEYAAR